MNGFVDVGKEVTIRCVPLPLSLFLSFALTGFFLLLLYVGCEDESVRVTPVLDSLSFVDQSLSSFLFLVRHPSILNSHSSFLIPSRVTHTHTRSLAMIFMYSFKSWKK